MKDNPTDEDILNDQDDVQRMFQFLKALGYTENKKARSYSQLTDREFFFKRYDSTQYQRMGYACKFVLNGGLGFGNCFVEFRFDFDGRFLGHSCEEEVFR